MLLVLGTFVNRGMLWLFVQDITYMILYSKCECNIADI